MNASAQVMVKDDWNEYLAYPGEQKDWSIVDLYGNVISTKERLEIIETVENLPITLEKERIKQVISNNLITVLQWETGCGKSTQIPKFLSELWYESISTAPKVMAAMWLAERVSRELLNVSLE